MKIVAASFLFSSILLVGGCTAVPNVQERRETLGTLALSANLRSQEIQTAHFSLYSLSDTSQCEDRVMRVYIEGDGFAWITKNKLSDDPTPINPLGAKLMVIDENHCKAYIARPCQYIHSNECRSEYWDNKRFSPEVIQSYDEALEQLKKVHRIDSFVLIGYSGGGAIAALTTAKRKDVRELVTIAGNLDTEKWVKIQRLKDLDGSLNPAREAKVLSNVRQLHLVGKYDKIIPPEIYQSYRKKLDTNASVISVECLECSHSKGWEERWIMITPFLGDENRLK